MKVGTTWVCIPATVVGIDNNNVEVFADPSQLLKSGFV